jgi:hypothetical protein
MLVPEQGNLPDFPASHVVVPEQLLAIAQVMALCSPLPVCRHLESNQESTPGQQEEEDL